MHVTELVILIAAFAIVTVIGFAAHRWRRADLDSLHEWSLAGRNFGSWIS